MRTLVITTLTAVTLASAPGLRCLADEEFSLVIDPFTGAASLRNDGASSVDLDGYFVTSATVPVLDPSGWSSLSGNAFPGWQETSSVKGDRLGEVNLFQSFNISPGDAVGIGNPYVPFSPTEFGETEPALGRMNFSYTLAGDTLAKVGDVEFSLRNTIVLVIDPATGVASLENQSGFSVEIDSYLIKSTQSVLDVSGWNPLANSDSAWTAASGATNRIAEGNLFGSTPLAANGGSLLLGNPINPSLLSDEKDLTLEFTVAGLGTVSGGVLFASSGFSADFDGDGDVDGDDLSTWQTNYRNSGTQSSGDANGDGSVGGADFLTWQRLYTGSVLANATLAAVPEPSSCLMAFVASCSLGAARGRKPRSLITALPPTATSRPGSV